MDPLLDSKVGREANELGAYAPIPGVEQLDELLVAKTHRGKKGDIGLQLMDGATAGARRCGWEQSLRLGNLVNANEVTDLMDNEVVEVALLSASYLDLVGTFRADRVGEHGAGAAGEGLDPLDDWPFAREAPCQL
jgi:hypothetical protein